MFSFAVLKSYLDDKCVIYEGYIVPKSLANSLYAHSKVSNKPYTPEHLSLEIERHKDKVYNDLEFPKNDPRLRKYLFNQKSDLSAFLFGKDFATIISDEKQQ